LKEKKEEKSCLVWGNEAEGERGRMSITELTHYPFFLHVGKSMIWQGQWNGLLGPCHLLPVSS
jgi:hypothetical protein